MARILGYTLATITALFGFVSATAADAEPYKAGEHYEVISPELPAGAPGTIEVVELFWYGCPHCFEFEPFVSRWLETKPADVSFRRSPALFNQSWVPAARAFYAAEILGVSEKLHPAIFASIHQQRRRLQTDEAYQALFVEQGVTAADFDSAVKSFAMDGKVKQAMNFTRGSGIQGVPAVIVNGKYRTSAGQAGSFEEMLKVVDWLVAMEREGR